MSNALKQYIKYLVIYMQGNLTSVKSYHCSNLNTSILLTVMCTWHGYVHMVALMRTLCASANIVHVFATIPRAHALTYVAKDGKVYLKRHTSMSIA